MGSFLSSFLSDLFHSRELTVILFLRNLKAAFRQSLLGYVWIVIPPFFTTAIWYYLNASGVLSVAETPIPYPVFVLTGQLFWSLFSESFHAPLKSFNEGKGVFTKLRVSPEAFILADISKILLDFVARLIATIPILIFYKVNLEWTALYLPLLVFIVMSLGVGFGLFLIPIGSLYGDIGRAVMVGLPVLMYTAPVIYPVPESGMGAAVCRLNPLTPVIQSAREWLYFGTYDHSSSLFLIAVVGVVSFIFGGILLRVVLPHLVERFGM